MRNDNFLYRFLDPEVSGFGMTNTDHRALHNTQGSYPEEFEGTQKILSGEALVSISIAETPGAKNKAISTSVPANRYISCSGYYDINCSNSSVFLRIILSVNSLPLPEQYPYISSFSMFTILLSYKGANLKAKC